MLLLVVVLGAVGAGLLAGGEKRNPGAKRAAYVVLAAAALLLLVSLLPEAPPGPARSRWSVNDVRTGCREGVSAQLVSPRSMRLGNDFFRTAPAWSADQLTWTFSFDVEAQNAFGVWLESRWLCQITDDEFISVRQLR